MTEATIYAVVVVTCATLAYFWPTIRRKCLWWKLNRQMGRTSASAEEVAKALNMTAERVRHFTEVWGRVFNGSRADER